MDAIIQYLPLLLGLIALIIGAEILVRSSSTIGLKLGLHPVTVGATIVGFGTSAPELVVSVLASWRGEPGIAMGNVIGSNVANIGLVLGVCAVIRPVLVDPRALAFEYPFALAGALALPLLAWNGVLGTWEGVGLGAALLVFLAAYLSRTTPPPLSDTTAIKPRYGIPALIVFSIAGLAILVTASNFVVDGVKVMARDLGFSETAISSTVVAVGTSLPELATGIVAAYRGAHGLLLGNVLGSNIFNGTLVLGPAAIVREMAVDDLTRFRLIPIMAGATLLLLPLLLSGRRLGRREGLLLLLVYGFFLWNLRPS